MIDEDRTLSVLGVDVSTLTSGSNKMVFRVCENCGGYNRIRYGSHRWTHCRLCASREPERCLKVSETHKARWKGEIHFNTGRTLSDEHKEKLRIRFSGEGNPMYGKHHSEEALSKISGENNHMFGKHHLEETKKKISRKGPEHNAWRGGITPLRQRLYNSQPHQAWRKAVFDRDQYTCQMCGDDTGNNLQAHHIEPVREHINDLLLFDVNNGITLCKECHKPTIMKESDFESFFYALIGAGLL